MASNKLSVFLLLLSPFSAYAQQYTVADIKAKADAELHKLVNDDIFAHCVMSEGSYYGYKDNNGELQWADMSQGNSLKGKPLKTGVNYTLSYKYSKCRIYDSVWGRIFFEFDEHMALTNTPNVNFIPDFMIKGEACRFISKKDAMQKGIDNGKRTDPHTYGGLNYIEDKKQFVWSFFHMDSPDELPPAPADITKAPLPDIKEHLQWNFYIDAETGMLLDSHEMLLLHRGPYITLSDDD